MADQYYDTKTGTPVVLPRFIPPTPFTPTFNNLAVTNNGSWWWAIGELAFCYVDVSANGAATGTVFFNPSSMGISGISDPINYGKLGSRQTLGAGNFLGATNNFVVGPRYGGTGNQISFVVNGSSNLSNSIPTGDAVANATRLTFTLTSIPITDFAGGFVAYGTGLAGTNNPGLMKNRIPTTNITLAELSSLSNISLDASDIAALKYHMDNDMVTLWFRFDTFNIGVGTATFSFVLPAGVPRPSVASSNLFQLYDNTGSAWTAGSVIMLTNGTLQFSKLGGANFTGGVGSNYAYGQLSWPIT